MTVWGEGQDAEAARGASRGSANEQDAADLPTPADEIGRRIAGLQAQLQADGLDAALIVQNADLYYYAGTVQRSYLLVPAAGEAVLFVRRVVERARAESPLRVAALSSPGGLPALIGEHLRGTRAPGSGRPLQRIGLELDVLPVAVLQRLQEALPGAEIVDISGAVVRQRAVKSPHEIALIRAAAAITDGVCARIPELLEEGLTEAELAGRAEAVARTLGHEGIIRMRGFNQEMFYGQLVSGANATAPGFLDTPLSGEGLSPAVAQGVTMRRILRGEPIVFDFVSVRAGYIADFTRMFSLGPLPVECRRAFAVALEIESEVAAAARPGVACRALYEIALARARATGLQDGFMGAPGYNARFIGHGVGLELDELPVLSANDELLEEGMVFALEPKFVLPGIGAVGIEDTFAVTASGVERLSDTERRLFEL
jgi:Xaa-Pro aminopeptidase